ncbi:MAG: PilZ domain-containing protein [Desulfobacteraceae bacterium]|nr:PilZ domain-containing protein [Desulfobacteraceae bacterium]
MAVLNDDDRRKYSRVGFATEIKIVLKVNEKQVKLEGHSKDLSQRGLFVSTDKRFASGTLCFVKIYLAGGIEKIELSIEGTVVRQTEIGIGIVFNSMDVDTYSHLKNIVYYNSVDDSD